MPEDTDETSPPPAAGRQARITQVLAVAAATACAMTAAFLVPEFGNAMAIGLAVVALARP